MKKIYTADQQAIHRSLVIVRSRAIGRRADDAEFWQGVAGGVEDDETPMEAACRELLEETRIAARPESWVTLDARGSVPAKVFRD